MTILYILAAAIIAYYIGYHRGHTGVLPEQFQMLAGKIEALFVLIEIGKKQPNEVKEDDTPTTP